MRTLREVGSRAELGADTWRLACCCTRSAAHSERTAGRRSCHDSCGGGVGPAGAGDWVWATSQRWLTVNLRRVAKPGSSVKRVDAILPSKYRRYIGYTHCNKVAPMRRKMDKLHHQVKVSRVEDTFCSDPLVQVSSSPLPVEAPYDLQPPPLASTSPLFHFLWSYSCHPAMILLPTAPRVPASLAFIAAPPGDGAHLGRRQRPALCGRRPPPRTRCCPLPTAALDGSLRGVCSRSAFLLLGWPRRGRRAGCRRPSVGGSGRHATRFCHVLGYTVWVASVLYAVAEH